MAEKQEQAKQKDFLRERETISQTLLDDYLAKVCPELITVEGSADRKNALHGITLEWSKTLNSTAGRATYKRGQKTGRIELSTKVLTSMERLRDTLAHELCHLLAWCMDDDFARPHGRAFKKWASRCERLLKGVHVGTTHSYEIEYRYVWTCSAASPATTAIAGVVGDEKTQTDGGGGCGREYGRHSKSIDVNKVVCGKCRGRLVQTKPKPRGQQIVSSIPANTLHPRGVLTAIEPSNKSAAAMVSGKAAANPPATPSGLDRFAAFRRDNLNRFKLENPGLKYKDVMQLVTQAYRIAHPSPAKGKKQQVPPLPPPPPSFPLSLTWTGGEKCRTGHRDDGNVDRLVSGLSTLAIANSQA